MYPDLNIAKFLLAFLTLTLEAVILFQIWYYSRNHAALSDTFDIEHGDPELKLKQLSQSHDLSTTMDTT